MTSYVTSGYFKIGEASEYLIGQENIPSEDGHITAPIY